MPPPTPALPDYRLHCMIPFQTIGIDYAGPVYVKDVYSRCGELFKCYFLLITCTASRAVDIEFTSAFSSNLLILALRWCFACRGPPSEIVSDNFKTFKAVEIRDFIWFNRIHREFILERSAWWREFYEQLVGVIKNCLKKVIGKAKLNFEELNTGIVGIEKCVNSRPLTYLSEEHEDTVLTPNHLIYGRNIDRNESVQHEFMNLVAMIWENGELIVKLYFNILQNHLLKNIY